MNTNLNNIPLDIFLDYVTEQTQQEWILEYLFVIGPMISIVELNFNFGNGNNSKTKKYYGNGYYNNYGYETVAFGKGYGNYGCNYYAFCNAFGHGINNQ